MSAATLPHSAVGLSHAAFQSTFPRRGKVAREARRMGDVSTRQVFVFDIPHPPFGHLPPPGDGKTKSNQPFAIALCCGDEDEGTQP